MRRGIEDGKVQIYQPSVDVKEIIDSSLFTAYFPSEAGYGLLRDCNWLVLMSSQTD